jgi:hypothetical protein
LWKSNFGHTAAGSGAGLGQGAVPEPCNLLLGLMAAMGMAVFGRTIGR